MTQQPPAPPAVPYPAAPAGSHLPAQRPPGGMPPRTKMIIAVAAGVFVGIVVLLVVIAAARGGGVTPQGGGPGPGGVPSPGSPGEDGAIPAEGTDIFLAGGVVTIPIPPAWTEVTRADVRTGPGGHPEAAVLQHAAGFVLGVYVTGPDPAAAADIGGGATAAAQEWTRDGEQVQVDPAQGGTPSGTVTAAATVRYRYVLRGRSLEGFLVHSARQDGYVLSVFVDAPAGTLDQGSGAWAPLVDAIVATFSTR